MKNTKKLLVTTEIMEKLECGYLTDSELGNLSESISELFFDSIGTEYQRLNPKGLQSRLGDYVVLNNKLDEKYIEVKTSHTFRKTKTDKIAIDYKYTKKNSRGKIPYIQSNTNNNLGWIYNNKADILICINPISKKLYFIKDYPIVKQNIIKLVEEYNDKVNDSIWYYRNYKNDINKYLEGSIVTNDNCKDSLVVNLTLSKESINYFGGKVYIYNLISDTDVEIA